MKTTIITMLALTAGALAFSACSKDDAADMNEDNTASLVTLTAWQEGAENGTRAVVDGTNINWQSGDQIKVFGTDESKAYTLTAGEGTTTGSFTGEAVADAAYALYPYQEDATVSSGAITAEVPMTQIATPGTFDPKAALMVGALDGGSVQFRNVMSYVKVTVPACKQVTLKAKDEWTTMAGKVNVTVAAAPAWAETSAKEGQAFVRLVPQTEGGTIAAGTYYIAVLPQTTSEGFEVIYNVDDEIYCKQTAGTTPVQKQFVRNKVKNIGGLGTADGQYTYKVGTAVYGAVTFADRNIGATSADKSSAASYGDYFAWGAIRPAYISKPASGDFTALYKDGGFTAANAPYYDSNTYNTGDNLQPADDIVSMLWGGNWRMPTKTELYAMVSEGSYASLPLAGCCYDASFLGVDIYGFYWSSTADGPIGSGYLFTVGSHAYVNNYSRLCGLSVRPVKEGGTPEPTPHEFVEMGDGLKWAACNLGAENPEDYGDYFAWGGTSGAKADYSWATYEWMQEGQSDWMHITKYTIDDDWTGGIWYAGGEFVGDNKTVLEAPDDAARVRWGGGWRMPTDAEWTALRNTDNFTWAWTDDYDGTGVSGRIVTSKVSGYEGNRIFLPAAGRRDGTELDYAGSCGYYWSSSLSTVFSDNAFNVYFGSDGVYRRYAYRYFGLSVRPVSE